MTVDLPGPVLEDENVQAKFDVLAAAIDKTARFFDPPVTNLPTIPQDGQVITYTADATNGVSWLLRYRAASASSYKWEYIGGSSLFAEVTTAQGTATTASYVALTTAGPSITLPLAGDFDVEIGARFSNNGANAGGLMSYDIGATGAVDADAIVMLEGSSNDFKNLGRARRKTALTAVALVSKYKCLLGNTATFENRWMRVMPVRVG